jgi:hypothetical protein
MTLYGRADPMNAVCEQTDWDAMERARPGFHKLILAGIATEAEAEKVGRGTSGETKRRG